MHSTLAEHARCCYGDEYRPAVESCAQGRDDWYFIETLTFANAGAITAMLHEMVPGVGSAWNGPGAMTAATR